MTTSKTNCASSDAEWIVTSCLSRGELVQVIDEPGLSVGLAIYLGTVRPYQLGLWKGDLLESLKLLGLVSTSAYTTWGLMNPYEWHHALVLEGRPHYLNSSYYTLLPVPPEDASLIEPHT